MIPDCASDSQTYPTGRISSIWNLVFCCCFWVGSGTRFQLLSAQGRGNHASSGFIAFQEWTIKSAKLLFNMFASSNTWDGLHLDASLGLTRSCVCVFFSSSIGRSYSRTSNLTEENVHSLVRETPLKSIGLWVLSWDRCEQNYPCLRWCLPRELGSSFGGRKHTITDYLSLFIHSISSVPWFSVLRSLSTTQTVEYQYCNTGWKQSAHLFFMPKYEVCALIVLPLWIVSARTTTASDKNGKDVVWMKPIDLVFSC